MTMLNCPFCGGQPEIRQTGKKSLWIKCRQCHFGLKQSVLKFSLEWLEESLIEAWNKRFQK